MRDNNVTLILILAIKKLQQITEKEHSIFAEQCSRFFEREKKYSRNMCQKSREEDLFAWTTHLDDITCIQYTHTHTRTRACARAHTHRWIYEGMFQGGWWCSLSINALVQCCLQIKQGTQSIKSSYQPHLTCADVVHPLPWTWLCFQALPNVGYNDWLTSAHCLLAPWHRVN